MSLGGTLPSSDRPRAIVVGGSMAGLFAAHLLLRAGWAVNVYERASWEMAGRGAGIVTHTELFEVLEAAGIDTRAAEIGVPVVGRRVFDRSGRITGELALPQILTSWGRLYHLLRDALPDGVYHHGCNVERISLNDATVVAHFANGESAVGDLLIGADGILSGVRAQWLPDVSPSYAGYVAWRGLLDVRCLSPATRSELGEYFSFFLPTGEQMLGYPVGEPVGSGGSGNPQYNFVWYRPAPRDGALRELLTDRDGVAHDLSIPPHLIRPEVVERLRREAHQILPPQFAEVVEKTPQPLIQAIQDLEAPRMALSARVAIIGDAAFVARPHVGMGVTKAAGDARALADAIGGSPGDIERALIDFEARRLAFGRAVVQRARRLGVYMQAQLLTPEERASAELYWHPERIMAETAVASGIFAQTQDLQDSESAHDPLCV